MKQDRTSRSLNKIQSVATIEDIMPSTDTAPVINSPVSQDISGKAITPDRGKSEPNSNVQKFVSKFNDVGITPLLIILRGMNVQSGQFALLNMFLRAPILKALPAEMISAELMSLDCSAGMTDGLISVLNDSIWASDNLKRNSVYALRDIINSRISKVASSTSALTVFCRNLGFSKYEELREGLMHDNPEASILRAMRGILSKTEEINDGTIINTVWSDIIENVDINLISKSNALKVTLTSLFTVIHYRGKKGKQNGR